MPSVRKLRRAAASLAGAIRADQEMLQRSQEKYRGAPAGASLASDLVQKVGLQIMAGYRVMRFFSEIESPLGARIASRVLRHLYGSDIHWDAQLDPGVMIVHGMGMAISGAVRVGADVTLFQHCTLGEGRHPDTQETGSPTIEDGAVIGVGAVILGPVTIGRKSKVMPGCVVTRSVAPESIVESPDPAVRARGKGKLRLPSAGEAE